MSNKDPRMKPTFQYECAQFVDREVIMGVSSLIYNLNEISDCLPADVQNDLFKAGYVDNDEFPEEPREVFEHWVVSFYLAAELRNQDEKIIDDIMGVGPVWCRTTTGQSIGMDEVIQDIVINIQNR